MSTSPPAPVLSSRHHPSATSEYAQIDSCTHSLNPDILICQLTVSRDNYSSCWPAGQWSLSIATGATCSDKLTHVDTNRNHNVVVQPEPRHNGAHNATTTRDTPQHLESCRARRSWLCAPGMPALTHLRRRKPGAVPGRILPEASKAVPDMNLHFRRNH